MTFFIDNNLSQALAKGIQGFGEDAIHLVDKFQPTARDEEWLEYVGKNGAKLAPHEGLRGKDAAPLCFSCPREWDDLSEAVLI